MLDRLAAAFHARTPPERNIAADEFADLPFEFRGRCFRGCLIHVAKPFGLVCAHVGSPSHCRWCCGDCAPTLAVGQSNRAATGRECGDYQMTDDGRPRTDYENTFAGSWRSSVTRRNRE